MKKTLLSLVLGALVFVAMAAPVSAANRPWKVCGAECDPKIPTRNLKPCAAECLPKQNFPIERQPIKPLLPF